MRTGARVPLAANSAGRYVRRSVSTAFAGIQPRDRHRLFGAQTPVSLIAEEYLKVAHHPYLAATCLHRPDLDNNLPGFLTPSLASPERIPAHVEIVAAE